MSNHEKLSAFVDSELNDRGFLSDLLKDEQMVDQFSRYQLIGDVMRGDTLDDVNLDVASSVMSALDDEPTVMAPQKATPERGDSILPSNVVPLFKKVGQYAIAASVAASVVIGVQLNTAQQDSLTPAPVLDTVPFVGIAEPVSLQAQPANVDKLTEQQELEQRRKINALLQDHTLQQRMLQQN
ncbi:sigma-E factor negative regulatory protein [Motilimonas eburnea]|uniref:sigma-E factor negative regulatory protein n=1 Tax=Motilimonas eburnea TaxID=1737488 RepID=UPI001E4CDF8A|nr:RseA family anti-sigma factor [Motilimonas eburnea]MCE2571440.1 anti-sigma factor [Motilimonas eburnea]